MNNQTLALDIVNAASINKKFSDLAKEVNFSNRHLNRICKDIFTLSYKDLRAFFIWAQILMLYSQGKSACYIANIYFDGDNGNLYHYVRKFSSLPLKQIKGEVALMTISETNALKALASKVGTNQNLTLKALGVSSETIVSLRDKGFQIISVPGRYNGGYNLSTTSKSVWLAWINNIRLNRFGIQSAYTF